MWQYWEEVVAWFGQFNLISGQPDCDMLLAYSDDDPRIVISCPATDVCLIGCWLISRVITAVWRCPCKSNIYRIPGQINYPFITARTPALFLSHDNFPVLSVYICLVGGWSVCLSDCRSVVSHALRRVFHFTHSLYVSLPVYLTTMHVKRWNNKKDTRRGKGEWL